jgi:hypothetical protein
VITMGRRTLLIQNQIRSTTSGIEFDDELDLSFAEVVSDESPLPEDSVSGTVIQDLNYLRTAVRDIKGNPIEIGWNDQVVGNATFITLSGARGALSSLQLFTGSTGDLDVTPDYDTLGGAPPVFISQGDPLNVAIEKLDANLAAISGSITPSEISKQTHIRLNGSLAADTTIDLSVLIAGDPDWTSTGDAITWNSATDFVENVSVFVNGTLMLPGVDINANRDVYFVGTPDQLAFGFKIKKNESLQIWRFPATP